jgi:hypothetical protein
LSIRRSSGVQEFKEFEEARDRSQEPESRSQKAQYKRCGLMKTKFCRRD